ncbi:hypothetical protein [Paludisphaera soli]|uniref:hypothetical protein n=1 Tax=Paludisphaera soli TaxID=2712865 RepID=UPI0013EA8186|nr:hypothetical protein [Paludisphaera soli]
MGQVTQASEAEVVGPRETRDLARRGLRVLEESGRFVIEPAPLEIPRTALQLATTTGAFLVMGAVFEGSFAAPSLVAAALFVPGILALEYAVSRCDASRGPLLVVDQERGSIEIPRSGDAFAIADVESVTLRRGSHGGPDGLVDLDRLGLLARRGGALADVPVAWSRDVDQGGEVAARLADALNRPLLLLTTGDGS